MNTNNKNKQTKNKEGVSEIIKANGDVKPIEPNNRRDFKLNEMQKAVGGYIEIVETIDNRLMIINDDGKRSKLEPNEIASALYKGDDIILGDVLVITKKQIR